METSISSPMAAQAAGISYRQLDHWDRTGLAKPSIRCADGSGTQREYDIDDVYMLRAIAMFTEAGVNVGTIEQPLWPWPPSGLVMLIDGKMLVFSPPDFARQLELTDQALVVLDVQTVRRQVDEVLETMLEERENA